ncbi:hypothetical protein JXL19_10190 [bacterium]|nr:hypothetical protein [bacterium]
MRNTGGISGIIIIQGFPVLIYTLVIAFFPALFPASSSAQDDSYTFDLSEVEKRPYEIGGYVELNPVIFGLDRDSALYKLRFQGQDEGDTAEEYRGAVEIRGSYEKGIARVYARAHTEVSHACHEWSETTELHEGYLSIKPPLGAGFDIGKRTLKWGKGYAWNPAAFVDMPKDPDDPEGSREGFTVISADFIKSFNAGLKTLSFTPVIVPVTGHLNEEFGRRHHLNIAGRLYMLLYDTDIDLIMLAGTGRPDGYGLDFSRNILTNFEIHGELAIVRHAAKKVIASDGNISESQYNPRSLLFGIRYLTSFDMTIIAEYYHNGAGYTEAEMGDYYAFIRSAYSAYLLSNDNGGLAKAMNISRGDYGRANPMQDYLYLRINQKDPFDILYVTPSLTLILNCADGSFSIAPELLYEGITNISLSAKLTLLSGGASSEYGEKQNDWRAECKARVYF